MNAHLACTDPPISPCGQLWSWARLAASLLLLSLLGACSAQESEPVDRRQSWPLQPLVYTEYPDLTPEAAAIRERRLMRRLQDGALVTKQWGALDTEHSRSALSLHTSDALGQALHRALVMRDESLWELCFLPPEVQMDLAGVELEIARQYVDELQGKSLGTWQIFDNASSSEIAEGGIAAVLTLESLVLGPLKEADTQAPGKATQPRTFTQNTLRLRYRQSELVFELRIPRIIAFPDPLKPGEQRFAVASEVQLDHRLRTLLEMGLHLKPELLRSSEYPFPLKVGNFWRYRRYREDSATTASAQTPPIDERATDNRLFDSDPFAASAIDATEVLFEVTAVERYGTLRLVTFQRSYNDAALSRHTENWLVSPRRIYVCDATCRTSIQELATMLEYFERQTPIYVLPLHLGQSWSSGGSKPKRANPVFQVHTNWHDLDVAAGTFVASFALEGTGPLSSVDPHFAQPGLLRFFSPGKGEVRRIIPQARTRRAEVIVEELVEYRITP